MNSFFSLHFKDLSQKLYLSSLTITLLKHLDNNNFFDNYEQLLISSFILQNQENGSLTLFTESLPDLLNDFLEPIRESEEYLIDKIIKEVPIFLKNIKLCSNAVNIETPFIYTNNTISTRAFYLFESELQEKIKSNLIERARLVTSNPISPIIDKIKPIYQLDKVLEKAIYTIINSNFLLLSGGPGFGKTTALTMILKAILVIKPNSKIVLAAPTGRAASRMSESITSDADLSKLSIRATTMHKLLGINEKNNLVQKNKFNHIIADVVAIDESSMLDAKSFYWLLDALKTSTKLILIGDGDQLSSIYAGSILSDMIANSDNPKHLLHNNIAILQKSYRSDKTILDASKAVLTGNIQIFNEIINKETNFFTCHYLKSGNKLINELIPLFKLKEIVSINAFKNANPLNLSTEHLKLANQMLNHFKKFIVLSPLSSNSQYSTTNINNSINYITNAYKSFYHGKPVIITQNNNDLNLTNGERGVIIEIAGQSYAFFGDGKLILSEQLLSIETSYAITIHKSQGSEFDDIALVLPINSERLLSRNLIYTALTRTKKHAYLFYHEEALIKSINKVSVRSSNLSNLFLQ